MPVIPPGSPSQVQLSDAPDLSVLLPKPVNTKPKSPVNFGGDEAPQPQQVPGPTGVPPAPRPKRQLTGVILPFSPPPKQMSRVRRYGWGANREMPHHDQQYNETPKHDEGWITPEGKYLANKRGQDHDSSAAYHFNETDNPRQEAFDNGWVHVANDVDERGRFLAGYHPAGDHTEEQLKTLRRLAKDNDFETYYIEQDGKSRPITIKMKRLPVKRVRYEKMEGVDTRSPILPKKLSRLPVKVVRVV